MATFDDLAERYAQRLLRQAYRIEALEVVKEIESLTYAESGARLSYEDKRLLVAKIRDHILGAPLHLREANNEHYLNLVDYMMNLLNK